MRPLKPAPEPKPVTGFSIPAPGTAARPSSGAIEELVRETADLGFSRESHAAPPAPVTPELEPVPPPEPPAAARKKPMKKVEPTAEPAPNWSIKFEADNTLYTELLLESRKRRVSLKYLMLQILDQQGYTVDLEKAAQDGRRNR